MKFLIYCFQIFNYWFVYNSGVLVICMLILMKNLMEKGGARGFSFQFFTNFSFRYFDISMRWNNAVVNFVCVCDWFFIAIAQHIIKATTASYLITGSHIVIIDRHSSQSSSLMFNLYWLEPVPCTCTYLYSKKKNRKKHKRMNLNHQITYVPMFCMTDGWGREGLIS